MTEVCPHCIRPQSYLWLIDRKLCGYCGHPYMKYIRRHYQFGRTDIHG